MDIDYATFYNWLIETQSMSDRSARDVVSRCKRVCKMLGIDSISDGTLKGLEQSEIFNERTIYIKSQLKRAVILWGEYRRTK